MVNGVNGITASRPVTKSAASKRSVPLDLSTVERRHQYGTETRERLFGLPTAPTYRPDKTEFSDPLKYIEKIAPHAKKFGICKIIPPDDWQPEFAINTETFKFRTRKQELNSMEAKCRASLNYIDQLYKFHTQNGTPMRGLPLLDSKPMDLYQLKEAVEKMGGYRMVNNTNKSPNITNLWSGVAGELGFSDNPSLCLSLAVNLKNAYQRYILPYETFLVREKPRIQANPVLGSPPKTNGTAHNSARNETQGDNEVKTNGASSSTSAQEDFHANSSINGATKVETPVKKPEHDVETRARKRLKRNSERPAISPSPTKKVAMEPSKPGENCETCGRGDDGVHMLLCDGCEAGYHIYCLDPPLSSVPKIDWYCSKCLVGTGEFGFEEGGSYSLAEFQKKANDWKTNYFRTQNAKVQGQEITSVTEADVEKEFWRLVQDVHETVEIEYGADIHSSTHGSAFPTLEKNPRNPYSADPWNLNIMPLLEESLLRYIKTDISGMTVPWLYVGMCFSTFCWHNEDHYTYSINYQHFGETKTWYGIPGSHAEKFEDVMKRAVPELFEQQPDLLLQLVTIFSPERLRSEGVDVFACDQHANEFVVTFPQAYHAGFNQGFNFNEAVNFAMPDWILEGLSKDCVDRYRSFSRQPVFSHDELLLTAASHDHSIKTAMWLAPALQEMVARELSRRLGFREAHPEYQQTLVENDVPEDEYQCGVCKVFCYLSQIICTCTSKVTCLDHAEDLCDCAATSRTLRHRFTDAFLRKTEQITVERAKMPSSWKEKFFNTIKEGPTPHIKVLRTLLAEGDRISYPIEELKVLRAFVQRVNQWIEEATPLITKKGMTTGRRKSEKLKKIAKPPEINAEEQKKLNLQRQPDYPDRLVAEAKRLAFDSQEIQALQEKSEAIKAWRKDARALMAMPQISIDRCHEIIESGQALNVDLPEVHQFVTYVTQLKWLEEARPSFGKSIPLEDVIRMWDSGKACGVPVEALEMHRLALRRKEGEAWEEQVQKVLQNNRVPINTVVQCLNTASKICVKKDTLAKLQVMVDKAMHMQKEVEHFEMRTKLPENAKKPTLQEYQLLLGKLDLLVTKPQLAEKLPNYAKQLTDWTRKGKRIFGKSNAPMDIFGQHLDHVAQRNLACLSLDDIPRDPVEPSSREASPVPDELEPRAEIFCMCRQPEAGLMLECDVCHEWYHGKCLKVAKKDLKSASKYICPICDWREAIPRPNNRPKLEEMEELERDAHNLPLRTPELEKLSLITATAHRFKERVMPLLSTYLTLTSAELPTLKFYLRKLEGAEILLATETNFFRAKIHDICPIAPTPPPKIDESKSTKKPRLSKKKREELEALGLTPGHESQHNGTPGQNASGASSPDRQESMSPVLDHTKLEDDHQSHNIISDSPSVFPSNPNPYSHESYASPQEPYQSLSPQPQYGAISNSQYQSSVSTPAFSNTYMPDSYATQSQHFNPSVVHGELENTGNMFLGRSDLATDLLNKAIKSHSDLEPRDLHTGDDAHFLLDFASGSNRFPTDGHHGGAFDPDAPLNHEENNEDTDMMESFLNS
ncbi:protein of unknown function [Taphrina deformans PYCC 5710]|uniref:[histone H3]-trimethyl-L-lysine(4) demethylase n=1 Tax=Taphrina deformans (strain PYCC 5710 / ATCC 11124 / CBS 356.35 / IMI 108563 / JCM 9778 / NBRC 8474) TaxID=1097556 RepID=R4XI46_TAPDE|nr:protein of unknown function [Taphrina deformans PYCC 5710]|eukprot:CCG84149.1 protein of unknown function [Taphrina deformans PYCC 5710]